jgi:hypothetical protein
MSTRATSVAHILDTFTSFCLGSPPTDGTTPFRESTTREIRSEEKKNVTTTSAKKKRVVYPIASYPARLNSKNLVDQRRQSLQQNSFFRPVSEDECSATEKKTSWDS